MNAPALVVIAGPTAVGKTAAAIEIAKHFHTEIISADSRQFYKQMTIGTAKPSSQELAAVPHHFIDILDVQQEYNAGQFEEDVLKVLDELFKNHQIVVMAGGSGLYIDALLNGFDAMPGSHPDIRQQLNKVFATKGIEPLQHELQQKDPAFYDKIDKQNPQRLIRALEVIRSSGKPYSSFRKSVKKERQFRQIKIALNRDREELYQRINARVDQMLKQGLLEEVKSLLPYKNENALRTVGYQELMGHLEGKVSLAEAVDLIKRNTRRYAKRQLTWLRKNDEYVWFHPDEVENVIRHIQQQL